MPPALTPAGTILIMTLLVTGAVDTPLELAADSLRALPDQVPDISGLFPGREGVAVRFTSVIARASPRSNATHATLTSADGSFEATVPLAGVTDALLVHSLGAEPLPERLGGPVRMLIPGATTCKAPGMDKCPNVKAVACIHVHAEGQS
ncbi:MAG: molybdopterin-dependent oxidoreductase [bacterium]|nr:molybdopterin-dependent oxidoreductase [bacterium]